MLVRDNYYNHCHGNCPSGLDLFLGQRNNGCHGNLRVGIEMTVVVYILSGPGFLDN